MKKIFILLVTGMIASSCYLTKYTHSGDANSRLDFSQGKWLLNEIKASYYVKDKLFKITKKEFSELLGERLSVINETNDILISPNLKKSEISKYWLREIKNGSNYDYFINITTRVYSDEIGDILLGEVIEPAHNSVTLKVEIYDLNLLERVYIHSVNADLNVHGNGFAFAKSPENMLISSFKRVMRKIKKNRIHNK